MLFRSLRAWPVGEAVAPDTCPLPAEGTRRAADGSWAPRSRSAHTYFQGARPSPRKAGPSYVSAPRSLWDAQGAAREAGPGPPSAGSPLVRVSGLAQGPHRVDSWPGPSSADWSPSADGVCLPRLTPVPRAGGGAVGLCRPQPHPHPTLRAPPRGFQRCCLPWPGQRVHGGPP